LTLEDACRAGSFTIEKVVVGLDGVRRSTRRLGETITVTRVSDFDAAIRRVGAQDPRIAAPLRGRAPFVRDPRQGLHLPALPTRTFPRAAVTDARLDLGIVEQNDARLRTIFEWLAATQHMTWAELFTEQFDGAR
jgi:hypothetical protein